MTFLDSTGAALLTPEQVYSLIIEPLRETNLALHPAVATTYPMAGDALRVPLLTTDVGTGWVDEGAEITLNDAAFDEITINPSKLAGIAAISREAAEDTSPAAAAVLGQSIVRDLSHKLDTAFFGSVASPAPSGLTALKTDGTSGSVSTVTLTTTGTVDSLDYFVTAQAEVQALGGDVSAWVMSPNTLKQIRQLKVATGWLSPLVGTVGAGVMVGGSPNVTGLELYGAPVFVTPFGLADGVVWGLDADRIIVGLRDTALLDVDRSVFFTSDRWAVKATIRIGWAFPYPESLVLIH